MKTIILTLACLFLGPFFTWHSLSSVIEGMKAKSWPSTQGVVSSTNLETSTSRKGRISYRPVVKYGYNVGEIPFGGDRIDFGDTSTPSMEDAMEKVNQFEAGQPVTVYYDPKNPADSVLMTGSSGSHWLGLLVGLLISVVGVFSARGLWAKLHDNEYAPSGTGF